MGVKLRAENLSIGYPGHDVGSELNLTASSGDVYCLLGPNGSGKTTLSRRFWGCCRRVAARCWWKDGR